MPISRPPDNDLPGRRQFLLGLAGSVFTLIAGCTLLAQESDLDEAAADLEALLGASNAADNVELEALARQLRQQCQALLDAHRAFLRDFNRRAVDRTTGAAELEQLSADYQQQRQAQRLALLQLQDELHRQVPAKLWPEVQAVLYRKSRSITMRNLGAT